MSDELDIYLLSDEPSILHIYNITEKRGAYYTKYRPYEKSQKNGHIAHNTFTALLRIDVMRQLTKEEFLECIEGLEE